MSLIVTNDLSKSFGAEEIFSGVSAAIEKDSRIGMVGPNGSGKTTLLKILVDVDKADSGSIFRMKSLKIGYLPQIINVPFERSPLDECMSVFNDVFALRDKIDALSAQMTEDDCSADLLDEFGRLQSLFENIGGYLVENKVKRVLNGLALTNGEELRPWKQLSGGQRTRAYLAKVLLSSPDILILDEPTNHLDIYAVEWLESFLKEFEGAILVVSHDRFFLDQCVNTIWELSPAFEVYHGNYTAYLSQREERYMRLMKVYEEQQQFIQKEEEYIRRNIAGQNTRQAQGRRKRLETFISESAVTRPKMSRAVSLKLREEARSGDLILRTKDVKIGYHDDKKVLFSVPDLTLYRGECAALVGANGSGKSTFLKTILGKIEPLNGTVTLGSNLHIGYFAQAHEDLHPEMTLMEEIDFHAPQMLPGEIRDYLAKYLFSEDDVFKRVSDLSGGERGRLALAALGLQGTNLLLLDEPMNHLDVESQEILQSVLLDFGGTIIIVSHDRYLIDAVATNVWVLNADSTEMATYKGNFSQYREWCRQQREVKAEETNILAKEKSSKTIGQAQTGKSAESKKRLKRIVAIENEISEIEKKMADVSLALSVQGIEVSRAAALGADYQTLQDREESLLEEWSSLQE